MLNSFFHHFRCLYLFLFCSSLFLYMFLPVFTHQNNRKGLFYLYFFPLFQYFQYFPYLSPRGRGCWPKYLLLIMCHIAVHECLWLQKFLEATRIKHLCYLVLVLTLLCETICYTWILIVNNIHSLADYI